MKQKYPDNSIKTIIENLSCSLGMVLSCWFGFYSVK